METQTRKASFNPIFDNKGYLGGIAEKALKNLNRKLESAQKSSISTSKDEKVPDRVRYFMIGHTFKSIDKEIFGFDYDDSGILYSKEFTQLYYWVNTGSISPDERESEIVRMKELKELIDNIRNINAHYIHLFDPIKINTENGVPNKLCELIRQAFKLSVKVNCKNSDIVEFLFYRFDSEPQKKRDEEESAFQNRKKAWKERKNEFLKLSFDEAVDRIMFIDVPVSFVWKLRENSQEVDSFTITQGRYFSFDACLFIVSMFLYKNEAQQLISQIKGFKRNGTEDERSKLELFSLFSKKFTSQDVDNEERPLVKFHDLIVYLNRFPVAWNSQFELIKPDSDEIPESISSLCSYLSNLRLQKKEELDEGEEKRCEKAKKERRKHEKKVFANIESISFKNTSDVVSREGCNQDRFMLFAARYFAETCFFGADAEFKCYKFFTPKDEQNQCDERTRKEKYHDGRQVDFITYAGHTEKYPDWDTPFVVQQNTIQVRISIDGLRVIVNLQRDVVAFLLNVALYVIKNGDQRGETILKDYFRHQRSEREVMLEKLRKGEADAMQVKLLPKKLVGTYIERQTNPTNPYDLLLERAKKSQDRYKLLKNKAKEEGRTEEFEKRNKGKRFKLEFIRKAWHYMSFRELYMQDKEVLALIDPSDAQDRGHHSSLHITREQYNDFSRWMYCLDNENCKTALRNMLEKVGFLRDEKFRKAFEAASSLDDLYYTTLEFYEEWLPNHPFRPDDNRAARNYDSILALNTLYINFIHFIDFVKNKFGIDQSLLNDVHANKTKLIEEFYNLPQVKAACNGDTSPDWKSLDGDICKLHRKLSVAQYEDALLYELARHYRQADLLFTDVNSDHNNRAKVSEIYAEPIVVPIKDTDANTLYFLRAPFSKFERLLEELTQRDSEINRHKSSFLTNIPQYLQILGEEIKAGKIQSQNDKFDPQYQDILALREKWKNGEKREGVGVLDEADLFCFRNHVLKFANKISAIIMTIEKKAIMKLTTTDIETKINVTGNRIDIKNLNLETSERDTVNIIRNSALHFGLPVRNNLSYVKAYYDIAKFLPAISRSLNFNHK